MNKENTYNGYTNYETYRIQLEILSEMTPEDFGTYDQAQLAGIMQEYVSDLLQSEGDGLCKDYALAFIGAVNWWELAELMIESYPEEKAA